MQIWLLHISHRHGDNHSLHSTEEKAFQGLVSFVREWWELENRTMNKPCPKNDKEAVENYFELVEDETANIVPLEVDG